MTERPAAAGFLDERLGDYLDALGSDRPLPASGTTAALVGAAAAALVEKAARISTRWEGSAAAVARARELRNDLTSLGPADVAAYERALRLARTAAELPPTERARASAEAFAGAAGVPLTIAETAADTAELAAETAVACTPAVRPDAEAAAALAEAAARASALLVAANLAAVRDDERLARCAAAVDRAAAALARCAGTSAGRPR